MSGESDKPPVDWALFERKDTLRRAMRTRLEALSAEERAEHSGRIVSAICRLPAFQAARRVLLFAPLPSEPDVDALWTNGALAGKECAYPRVEGMTLRLYYVRGLDELEPTRWGLREPPHLAAREADPDDIDVALVPGLVFDPAGGRLGRGGGFYDRLFDGRGQRTVLVGCGFQLQLSAEAVPTAPHDVLMDVVCTDQGIVE